MTWTESQKDEADELLVTINFGRGEERTLARAALQRWAGDDPKRLAYIAEHMSVDREVDTFVHELRGRYRRHLSPSREAVVRRAPRWPAIAGAIGFSACAFAVAAWAVNPVLSEQRFSSAIGEQVDVALDDGSHVRLNTATSIQFVNRLRSREVTMLEGEALYAVKHDSLRPFHVIAGATDIRDVGTRFSVRVRPADVDVAVLEGRVELSLRSGGPVVDLDANEAARATGTQIVEVSDSQEFDAMVSWKDRRLQFDGTPLSGVVHELQRYRVARIVLADNVAARFRVTGGFSISDPDVLLRSLPMVAPVTVKFQPDGTAVIASRR
ncbi:FecR domain-containing protein [Burkholderia contaminans]|uniref:FecR family protein n=1 Tax=Burkholderia contaminans TaxID=488447 RepID=UPI0031135AF3